MAIKLSLTVCSRKGVIMIIPQSTTGAGPGHMKSRYGQKFYYYNVLLFSALVQDGRTAVKSRYGANALLSAVFSPGYV